MTNMAEIWYIGFLCIALTIYYKLGHPDLYLIFSDFFNYAHFLSKFRFEFNAGQFDSNLVYRHPGTLPSRFVKKIGPCDVFNENGGHDS